MKTSFKVCLGVIFLALSVFSEASEVTAIIMSSPPGAMILDGGLGKNKALGKTPVRVSVASEIADAQRGVLQADRYTAKWPSGAVSKVFTFATPVSTSEFIYIVERPVSVAGEAKDKAAGQVHNAKPSVAAEIQMLTAKVQLWNQEVANYTKQKELAAIEQRQREADDARKRDELAARERRTEELQRQQKIATEVIEQRNGDARFAIAIGTLGFGPAQDAARQRLHEYDRDTPRLYANELACIRDLRRCNY